jgi:hypothetical protein
MYVWADLKKLMIYSLIFAKSWRRASTSMGTGGLAFKSCLRDSINFRNLVSSLNIKFYLNFSKSDCLPSNKSINFDLSFMKYL